MKAASVTIKLCDNLLKAEKQNYVVNTKDLLSLAMESIMLLGQANFSMNNMRRDRVKNSSQKDLHSLFEAGNPPITLLSGDDPLKSKGIIKTYLKFTISTTTVHRISRLERGQPSKEYFFVPKQQTQSTISLTIPKQQAIQELPNIVSIKPLGILSIRTYFRSRSNEFNGKLKHYFHKWKELTSDKEILQTVMGLKLEFLGDPPVKHNSYIPQFSKEDEPEIDLEIQKLLAKGVITKCEHESGEYISPIFVRQKPDGSCRLILNLKNLNEVMPCIDFKMETMILNQSVLSLITPGCYLALLDLKDAYYSVPIHPDHTKVLRFIWKNQLHKFLILPNGLYCGP